MREFLKALFLVVAIAAVLLGVLHWAPLPFPIVQKAKQYPILKETIFPLMDQAAAETRALGRQGLNQVPQLKKQKWLVTLLSEGKSGSGKSTNRSPAGADEPGEEFSGDIPEPVTGVLGDLLGDDFKVISQSTLNSGNDTGLKFMIGRKLLLRFFKNTKATVWNVSARGKDLLLVEVNLGSVTVVNKENGSDALVAVVVQSGTYRLVRGKETMAAVIYRNGVLVEELRLGVPADFPRLLSDVKNSPLEPSQARKTGPAGKKNNPKNKKGKPVEDSLTLDREPSGDLDSDLQ
jgi:hypothetical protein